MNEQSRVEVTGAELRALRDRLGMTQAELARELNVTQQNVSYLEQQERIGGPTAKLIRILEERHGGEQ